MASTSQAPRRRHMDVYDDRSRQSKALERWERQRGAWDSVKTQLLTTTGNGSASQGHADNLAFAGTRYRERQEELGMIEAAVPLSVMNNHYTWESLLRKTSDSDGLRSVQLGKSFFPYALFAEIKDPTARPPDHAVYTRTVAEDYLLDPFSTLNARTGRRETDKGRRSRLSLAKGGFTTTAAAATAATALAMDPRDADLDALEAALRFRSGRDGEDDDNDDDDEREDERGGGGGYGGYRNAKSSTIANPTHLAASSAYYRSQMRAYAPYIERRFAHYAVPRQFLHAEGTAVARPHGHHHGDTTDNGRNLDHLYGDTDPQPVQHYPPPQQRVAFPTSWPPSVGAADSGSITAATANGGGGRSRAARYGGHHDGPVSVRLSSVGEALALSAGAAAAKAAPAGVSSDADGDDGMNDSRDRRAETAPGCEFDGESGSATTIDCCNDEDDANSGGGVVNGARTAAAVHHPSLELSSRRLVLRSVPGELAHAQLTVTNTSSVTVYYSLVCVDLIGEELDGAYALDHSNVSKNNGSGKGQDAGEAGEEDALLLSARRALHAMAAHSAASRRYFRLSSPSNGVALPGETECFPFSVRAPVAGRFKQTYELLTIPPSPSRILVTLTAFVSAQAVSAHALARPVAAAMDSHIAAAAQRQTLRAILRDSGAFDRADAIGAIAAARALPRLRAEAEEARRAGQREAWRRGNAVTQDGLPYNRAVYDALEKVWDNANTALEALAAGKAAAISPQTGGKDEATATSTDSSPLRRISARRWNGSVNNLLCRLTALRDAPARAVLYDAVMALLRAARASGAEVAAPASPPSSSPSPVDPTVPDGERAGLASLLHWAAGLLASQLEDRRTAQFALEAELLQLPLEASPFAIASAAAMGTGGPAVFAAAGAMGAGGSPASARKRRVSAARRPNGGSAAGVAASGRAALFTAATVAPGMPGFATAMIHPGVPQYPLTAGGTTPAGAAPGTVVTPPVAPGSLRAHLREGLAPTPEDEAARAAEREEMTAAHSRRLEAERPTLVRSLWQQLSTAVEAGCELPLLAVVEVGRTADIAAVQGSEPMTVDRSSEAPLLKPAGNAKGSSGAKR